MIARSGGRALADQLIAAGAEVVFGIPGAQLDHAMDALAHVDGDIRFVHTRHEQGAGYMADGYARSSGRPGVLMVVPGPGLLNASSALATAWACSAPIVAIVGAIPTWAEGRRAGVLHELADQRAIVEQLTGWHRRVTSPDEIPEAVADAFSAAQSGRSRPAAVEIPADLFAMETTAPTIDTRAPHHPEPRPDAVDAAADLLTGATFPLIVAGNGVTMADGGADALRLAERLHAPLVLTTNGKAATDHDHPLVVPQGVGRRLIPQADVILAAGTRFVDAVGQPVDRRGDSRLVLLNVDEHDLGGWRDPSVAIHADARRGLRALAAAVADRHTGDRAHGRNVDAAIQQAQIGFLTDANSCEPLLEYVQAVRSGLPRDGIVVSDLTQAGYLSNAVFPVHQPRSYLTSGWQGTLGFSYPTALGAKVAHPERAVVAIIGDGGFGFTLSEMATATRHNIATIAVCFRDDAYGNVRRTQLETFSGRTIGTDLANPDFVGLARAHGLAASRATSPTELATAIGHAVTEDVPTVIEVPIGDVPSPWHLFVDLPTD